MKFPFKSQTVKKLTRKVLQILLQRNYSNFAAAERIQRKMFQNKKTPNLPLTVTRTLLEMGLPILLLALHIKVPSSLLTTRLSSRVPSLCMLILPDAGWIMCWLSPVRRKEKIVKMSSLTAGPQKQVKWYAHTFDWMKMNEWTKMDELRESSSLKRSHHRFCTRRQKVAACRELDRRF